MYPGRGSTAGLLPGAGSPPADTEPGPGQVLAGGLVHGLQGRKQGLQGGYSQVKYIEVLNCNYKLIPENMKNVYNSITTTNTLQNSPPLPQID